VTDTPDLGLSAGGPGTAVVAGTEGSPSLRADAARNRERIVAAAQEVFAEWGLNAALEKIARRAGVGIATLYRRFPTRANLIAASFERKMADYAAAAEQALENPDAWAGFCWLINKFCAMQASDAGLKDLITMRFPASSAAEDLKMCIRDRNRPNTSRLPRPPPFPGQMASNPVGSSLRTVDPGLRPG